MILDDEQTAASERAEAFPQQCHVGRFIFAMDYVRQENYVERTGNFAAVVVQLMQCETFLRHAATFIDDPPRYFERCWKIEKNAAQMGPSAEKLNQICAWSSAKVRDGLRPSQVQCLSCPDSVTAGANQTIHCANKSIGF